MHIKSCYNKRKSTEKKMLGTIVLPYVAKVADVLQHSTWYITACSRSIPIRMKSKCTSCRKYMIVVRAFISQLKQFQPK